MALKLMCLSQMSTLSPLLLMPKLCDDEGPSTSGEVTVTGDPDATPPAVNSTQSMSAAHYDGQLEMLERASTSSTAAMDSSSLLLPGLFNPPSSMGSAASTSNSPQGFGYQFAFNPQYYASHLPHPPPSQSLDLQNSVDTPPVLTALTAMSIDQHSLPPPRCSACSFPIHDKFIILFDERPFHSTCIRCSICTAEVGDEESVFARDGMIFCRKDYFEYLDRNYAFCGLPCATCQNPILKGENFFRFRDRPDDNGIILHTNCFYCLACRRLLVPGEQFVMDARSIFCIRDWHNMQDIAMGLQSFPALPPPPHLGNLPPLPLPPPPPVNRDLLLLQPQSIASTLDLGQPSQLPDSTTADPSPPPLPPPPQCHGKEDSVSTDEHDQDDGGDGGSNSSRNKRMRTSFKHHQLKTMKNYFSLNHNPDAKDLKQLAAKTGLTKRVLQVWFQNARAKYRRAIAGRDHSGAANSPTLSLGAGAILPIQQLHQLGMTPANNELHFMTER